ncbi:MAG: response regulator [Nitrososphaeraceae archaeon]
MNCKIINDGKEGLETIRSGQYDLVLLDLAMPGFTGFDVIK